MCVTVCCSGWRRSDWSPVASTTPSSGFRSFWEFFWRTWPSSAERRDVTGGLRWQPQSEVPQRCSLPSACCTFGSSSPSISTESSTRRSGPTPVTFWHPRQVPTLPDAGGRSVASTCCTRAFQLPWHRHPRLRARGLSHCARSLPRLLGRTTRHRVHAVCAVDGGHRRRLARPRASDPTSQGYRCRSDLRSSMFQVSAASECRPD